MAATRVVGVRTKYYLGQGFDESRMVLDRIDVDMYWHFGFVPEGNDGEDLLTWNPNREQYSFISEGYYLATRTNPAEPFHTRHDFYGKITCDDAVMHEVDGTGFVDTYLFTVPMIAGEYYKFRYEYIMRGGLTPGNSGLYSAGFTALQHDDPPFYTAIQFLAELPSEEEEWVEARESPLWGKYRILPWWFINQTVGAQESQTPIFNERGDETRGEASPDRTILTISSATLTNKEHRFLRDFRRLHRGAAKPFLARDVREYQGGEVDGLIKEFLGVGTGAETDFQMRIGTSYQGETIYREINFPDHAFPDLINEEDGFVEHETQYIRLWVNGVERTSGWKVDRLSGTIRIYENPPALGHAVEASFLFYNLVRFRKDFIATSRNGKFWKTDGANELVEPRGKK